MTEDEAKAKRCPMGVGEFSIVSGDTEGPRLRVFGSNCLGSACMAWRGKPNMGFEARAERAFRVEGGRLTPEPHEIDGFCGLAGAPA